MKVVSPTAPTRSVWVGRLWALLPVLSFGVLAPAPIVHAAFKLKRPALWAYGAGYIAALVTFLALVGSAPEDSSGTPTGAMSDFGVAMFLLLIATATIHAFRLRPEVFPTDGADEVMNRRVRTAEAGARAVSSTVQDADPDAVTCRQMERSLDALARYVESYAASFPGDSHALVRKIIATAREAVAFASRNNRTDKELDALKAIVDDYLPSSINTYLALPPHFALTNRNAAGKTPAEEFETQIRVLAESAETTANSMYTGDATRLREQSIFLQSRFSKSELDLD